MSTSSSPDRSIRASIDDVIHDEKRLQALRRYDILDTDPDPAFDRVAQLAAHLFDTPTALVNFVDADRQWFKSTVGADLSQTRLDVSFCVYTVEKGDVFVVENLAEDERFADNPYVTDHGFRFYAGAPLVTPDDRRLGTVCVLDTEPHSPNADTLDRLADLAAMVVDELELRRERIEHRQSEERWQRLVDKHPGPIHVSVEGRLAYANRAMADLFGVDAVDDLIGRDLNDFVPADEQARIRKRAQTVYEEREEAELIESRIERPDGTERIVVIRSVPIQYKGRAAAQTMIWDVTERKRAERQLRRSEQKFRTVVENAQPITFMIDRDGTFLLSEGRDLQALGLEPGEVVGDSMHDVYANNPEVIAAMQRALDGKQVDEEVAIDDHIFDSWCSPFHDEDGQVAGVIGMAADITERVRRQETLERQNDLFTKSQDIADVGAWEYDLRSGNVTLTDEGYRIHGLPPDADMTPERNIEFYHPDDQPKIRRAFRRAIKKGESYDLELRLITADGEHRWVHTRGEPQTEDGDIVRIRGTIQDVTERVRQREELETAKEAAEEADRIKSALLSNMNHEFRTPLTSIISFSELISREPGLAETFANRILGGGKRLLYTLNAVMDFAKLEAGSVAPTPEPVDASALARSIVNRFSHLIDQKDLTVQIHAPAEKGRASLDKQLLDQILTHLLHNAIKFTEEGTVEVSVHQRTQGTDVSVADSGIGIDPDFLPHVFDEFAQASSGYNRTHEGNGIGLTIVKRIVDQLDGEITLDSTPGVGTTVTVRLPNLEDSATSPRGC